MSYSIRESILRLIVSAEVRGAIANLKEFDRQVDQTASNTAAASTEVNTASKSLDTVSVSASNAKTALLGLGAGLAIGGIIAGIALLADKIHDVAEATKEAEKAQKEYVTALAQGDAAASSQLSTIQGLTNIIFDETLARDQRNQAFERLQQLYPAAFVNMNLENTSLQTLLTTTDNLTLAIKRQAEIKSLQSAIAKVQEQRNLIAAGQLDDQIKGWEKAEILIKGAFGGLAAAAGAVADLQTQKLKDADAILGRLQQKVDDLFKKGGGDQALLGGLDNPPKAPKIKAAKEKPIFPVFISPDLQVQPEDLDDSLTDFEKKLDKQIFETFRKVKDVKIPPPRMTMDEKELQKRIDQIAKTIKDTLAGGIEDIATGFADALSGKGFAQAISSFARTIGEGLKTVGKIMIEAAIKMEAIQAAAKALAEANPILGVAAGIAAIIAGTLIENLAQQNIKATKFASGAIVTGATNAIVGETGTEVIFPLKDLNKFVKGIQSTAQASLVATTKIQGPDMLVLIQRAQKNQNTVS